MSKAYYPCGIEVEDGIYMYDRYMIQEATSEENIKEYQIVDSKDLQIMETFIDKEEAEDSLKFWNQ